MDLVEMAGPWPDMHPLGRNLLEVPRACLYIMVTIEDPMDDFFQTGVFVKAMESLLPPNGVCDKCGTKLEGSFDDNRFNLAVVNHSKECTYGIRPFSVALL
eukprot:g67569.t1